MWREIDGSLYFREKDKDKKKGENPKIKKGPGFHEFKSQDFFSNF